MSQTAIAPVSEVRPFPKAVPDSEKTPPAVEAPVPAETPATPASAPAAIEAAPKKKRSPRRFIMPTMGLALLAGGSWYGYRYWTDGRFMISTDDAYVQVEMTFVSPKISGYVDSVPVA